MNLLAILMYNSNVCIVKPRSLLGTRVGYDTEVGIRTSALAIMSLLLKWSFWFLKQKLLTNLFMNQSNFLDFYYRKNTCKGNYVQPFLLS